MTDHKTDTQDDGPTNSPKVSRRKAVKTIAGGVSAIAAYHVLPSKWSTPIIEQVFLPAHAVTSGGTHVDPSIPVTEGHPDHPDFPHHPSSPSHPHNNPSAVIVSIKLTYYSAGGGVVTVDPELTLNRIASYTFAFRNLTAGGSTEYLYYVNKTIPNSLNPNKTVHGSPGDVIEVSVTNNVNAEVVTKTATVKGTTAPDFTIASGATNIILMTTVNSPPNTSGDKSIGTIDLANGAVESINHEHNTGLSYGALSTSRNYSPGTYTLSWSNNGSTASEASLSISKASTSVTFDPRKNHSWTLKVT